MQVTIEGTFYFTNRKIKEIDGFEEKLEVKDGMKEHEILSLMMDYKTSPLVAVLRKKHPKFAGLRKIKLASFVEQIPADEEVDTLESLTMEDDEIDSVGTITADKEFGDIAQALGGAKKRQK
jgi:hypothetical protein